MSVVLQNVTKRFTVAGTPAVANVSFSAPTGRITTLLGPSGSGKSTVLRIVAGLEIADAGSVLLDDADCTRMPVQKRGVGFVFQSYALFRHLTVAANIAFGLELRRLPKADIAVRVNEMLALIQLQDLAKRYPNQLSGGQRQRVALARALAIKPRVLLLDEPFGALDARVRVELREWLRRLHHETRVTTILVTHDQDEAMELSEHVVVMHEGHVEQAGAPHDIYDHPATPFVASFIGGANVLRGRVEEGRVSVGAFDMELPGTSEGAEVHAFVRPHDVKLSLATDGAPDVSVATIERLTRVGANVKVSLQLGSGESMAVEMPKAEIDSLGLREGDHVMVDLKEARVFVEDYSI